MLADSACLILTLSTYPLMTPRSLNPVLLWCTQKPGLRDLWSCRVSITLKSSQSPGLERGTAPKRRQGFFGSLARRLVETLFNGVSKKSSETPEKKRTCPVQDIITYLLPARSELRTLYVTPGLSRKPPSLTQARAWGKPPRTQTGSGKYLIVYTIDELRRYVLVDG